MTVLITGAGLVGSYAASQLLARGEKVVLLDVAPSWDNLKRVPGLDGVEVVRGDILDFPDLLRVIKGKGVRRIIHTAAFLTAGARERPYAATRVNILGTANILEAARNLDIERVVFTSSATVYYGSYGRPGPDDDQPQDEDFAFHAISQRPRGVYPTTKLAAEHLGLSYRDAYGVDFVAVRFAGVFGPWLGPVAGLPGMALKELAERPARGEKKVRLGRDLVWAGKEDFLYMKDAAQSTVRACLAPRNDATLPIYNVSMGRTYDFEEVLEILQEVYPGVEFEVGGQGEATAGGYPQIAKRPMDLSRSRREIGYEPEYPMAEALTDYRRWLQEGGH